MDFILTALSFISVDVIGVILTGKFYNWAYESEVMFFEIREDELRFLFSVFWFISIPIYFIILLFVTILEGLKLFYNKFV